MDNEKSIDLELVALQEQLTKIVDDWKLEYETRDKDKPSYEEQGRLKKFLEDTWDHDEYELDFVIAKKAWEDMDSMRGMDLIPNEKRTMSEGGLHIVILDKLHEINFEGKKDYESVSLNIPTSRSTVQVIIQPGRTQAVLNLYPDEIQGLQLVRKEKLEVEKRFEPAVKIEVPYKVGEKQDVGYKIHSLPSLATAWQEADRLGEHLVVKLNDGRILMIERSQQAVVNPQVNYIDNETGKPGKMEAWGFFHLEPEVI